MVQAVGSSTTPIQNTQKSTASAQSARAPDGDYKAANVKSSKTKDSDGDYKALSSAQSTTSSGTLTALLSQQLGG